MNSVQDIFIDEFPRYIKTHSLSSQQIKAANDIINCRTLRLGGHVYQCRQCGHKKVMYNSCRNRHCPLCQSISKEYWVDKKREDVINAPYFHVVFTIPQNFHMLIYQNQKLLYDLMYKAVSETIFELCQDKKYLGAKPGFFSILHTWGQDLHYHPHIHTVVLAGGLTDHNEWKKSSNKFFIPVKVLSKKFRGKFLYYLKLLYKENKFNFYGSISHYQNQKIFKNLLDKCYSQDWYTYSRRTFQGPIAVIKYLGRYTHRIAISNNRIICIDDDIVTIAVKDYEDKNKQKTITMQKKEFIRRFLMHILPRRFVRIRYYGILANRCKRVKLTLCRKLTASPLYKPRFAGLENIDILCMIIGEDVTLCKKCNKGKMQLLRSFLPGSVP